MKRLAIVALLLGLTAQAHAIVNGTVPADNDTRFDAVGALAVTWRLGLDPTNPDPATADHNWYCAATLTDPSTVYTAKHCVDSYGASAPHAVRFRRALDGSVGTIEAGVASFYHAYVASWSFPGGDVAIGTLAAPVSHITPIELGTVRLSIGTQIIVAGWGREGPDAGAGPWTRLRLCNTSATALGLFGIGFPTAWDDGPGCGPNNGDSGGATMAWAVDSSGGGEVFAPRLVGVTGSYGLAWRVPIGTLRMHGRPRR